MAFNRTLLTPPPGLTLSSLSWQASHEAAKALGHTAYERAVFEAQKQLDDICHGHFGSGGSRRVYDGGDVVYKIGELASQIVELEAYTCPHTYNNLPVAPCRIFWTDKFAPVLIMQAVRPLRQCDELPLWATQVDCCQVGIDDDDNWLIFDAGCKLEDEKFDRQDIFYHELPRKYRAQAAA